MSERMSEAETAEAPAELAWPARRKRSGFWRELSGILALGLCALAVVVLGFQAVAWFREVPGPGAVSVVGHLIAAGVAVLAQWFADRRRDWPGIVAMVVVFVSAAVALWMFWWA